jgi:hypothetical protein
VDADRPRLLHKVIGYTSNPRRALPREPEAVDELEQQRQTLDARRRWESEQRRAWGTARRRISTAVETFKADGHPDGQLLGSLRAIERQTERIDKRLGL